MDLTEDQLEKIRHDSIHERLVVGSDIRKLITELRSSKSLVKEMYQYRQEAINERELSESIVAEREELYSEVESLKKEIEQLKQDVAVQKKAHEIATDNFIIAAKQVEQAIAEWKEVRHDAVRTQHYWLVRICDKALEKLRD